MRSRALVGGTGAATRSGGVACCDLAAAACETVFGSCCPGALALRAASKKVRASGRNPNSSSSFRRCCAVGLVYRPSVTAPSIATHFALAIGLCVARSWNGRLRTRCMGRRDGPESRHLPLGNQSVSCCGVVLQHTTNGSCEGESMASWFLALAELTAANLHQIATLPARPVSLF